MDCRRVVPGRAGLARTLGVVGLVALAVAACTAPSGGGTATPTAAAGAVLVEVRQDASMGSYLAVDGRAVYLFTTDPMGGTACTGDCAAAWPPVVVPEGSEPTGGAGATGALSTIDRPDGTRQVSYAGHALYFFSGDTTPGATTGQGVGGVWFLVTPTGEAVGAGGSETPADETARPTCTVYCY